VKGLLDLSPAKLTCAVLVLSSVMSFAQSEDAKLAANLRTKDELLLNAVHRGNRRAWAEATTDDFLYIEDGEILHREAFLKELEEDGSSPLIIHTFEVHRIGDTAMVLHLDDVPQRPMRDRRNSHLLFSETWQRTGGEWKLRRVDINRLRTDPPAITLTQTEVDELAGTYTSGTKTCTIRREGGRIVVAMSGGPEQEWKAEARDVLFLPGEARSRKVFFRGRDGLVTGFADRDESSETDWQREATSKP
jgi:Domain of unknown function (DUF4440)